METPYIIGISGMTAHVASVYRIAAQIKDAYPDSIIIGGGIHLTALPEEALEKGTFDYVVQGEGEKALLALVEVIRGGGDTRLIPGVSFVADGNIIKNPEGPLLPDLDDLPMFPHHMFEHSRYDRGFLITSRGCPYKCTYCSQRMMTGSTYRFRSPAKILEEMDLIINKYGQNRITLYDDNFCVKRSRVKELCRVIIENRFNEKCKFSLQTRADNFPEELVPILSEAGFKMVGFGMETASQRLADLISKDETVEQHFEALELAKKHDMEVMLHMISGLPTETKEERKLSYQVLKKANCHAPKFNNLIPHPGTPMFEDLKHSNRVHKEPDWTNFDSTMSGTGSIFDKTPMAYVPETVSEFELKRDIIYYNLRVNLSWQNILNVVFRRGQLSWVELPPKWYFKPKEIYSLVKVGMVLSSNLVIAFLPLWITEPFMNMLNPAMKARPRIIDYDQTEYKPSGWDEENVKLKAQLLTIARHDKNNPNSVDGSNTTSLQTRSF